MVLVMTWPSVTPGASGTWTSIVNVVPGRITQSPNSQSQPEIRPPRARRGERRRGHGSVPAGTWASTSLNG